MVDINTTLDNIDAAFTTAGDLITSGIREAALDWLSVAESHIDNLVGHIGAEDIETLRNTVDVMAVAAFRVGVAA